MKTTVATNSQEIDLSANFITLGLWNNGIKVGFVQSKQVCITKNMNNVSFYNCQHLAFHKSVNCMEAELDFCVISKQLHLELCRQLMVCIQLKSFRSGATKTQIQVLPLLSLCTPKVCSSFAQVLNL